MSILITSETTEAVVMRCVVQERIRPGDPPGSITVRWHDDGNFDMKLEAIRIAKKDVTGAIYFTADGEIEDNGVVDSFTGEALSDYARRAVERLACRAARQALRQARRVLNLQRPPATVKG